MVGLDNHTGPRAALLAEDVLRLQRSLAAGTRLEDAARAFGVSIRTVQRYREAKLEQAVVAGHLLTFIVWRPGDVPHPLETRRRTGRTIQRQEASA